ncbi:MAG: peptidoglycan DD-metalloendopeptidase family protein [Lachnospiraceae bacterium]|nr:peptidoglycan DD-metalloendopeptidase family protein [Lachnospiraceae bacterium]
MKTGKGGPIVKMRNSLRYALLGILLFTALTAQLTLPSLTLRADAEELTNDSIKAKEAEIESAKQDRENMQNTLSDMKDLKTKLESDKSDLQQYVTTLDSSLTDIQAKIDDLKQKISDKEAEITKEEQELEEAQKVQDAQYAAMKKRIQFIYEKGNGYILEEIITAGSFGEMLNRADYIDELSAYDRQKLQEYKEQTKLVEVTKKALQEERTTLNQAKSDQETEEANMQNLIELKSSQINSLEGDISNKEASIAEYQQEIETENSTISALEAAVAAEKAKLAESQRRHYSGGIFTWPAPQYTSITSEFGYRVHPIYGDTRFHSGLDMAAPYGSPILAAYDGTVVAAGYNSSMGNYVMIDHGDGLYTIYMHASALDVSTGANVTAGQQIAAVGSTGASTGPHLHFSVRLNGQYVNPWSYLGK